MRQRIGEILGQLPVLDQHLRCAANMQPGVGAVDADADHDQRKDAEQGRVLHVRMDDEEGDRGQPEARQHAVARLRQPGKRHGNQRCGNDHDAADQIDRDHRRLGRGRPQHQPQRYAGKAHGESHHAPRPFGRLARADEVFQPGHGHARVDIGREPQCQQQRHRQEVGHHRHAHRQHAETDHAGGQRTPLAVEHGNHRLALDLGLVDRDTRERACCGAFEAIVHEHLCDPESPVD